MKEQQLDVTRESVARLQIAATKLVQRTLEDEKATDYRRGWFDGYLRAVEHVLEMENE